LCYIALIAEVGANTGQVRMGRTAGPDGALVLDFFSSNIEATKGMIVILSKLTNQAGEGGIEGKLRRGEVLINCLFSKFNI